MKTGHLSFAWFFSSSNQVLTHVVFARSLKLSQTCAINQLFLGNLEVEVMRLPDWNLAVRVIALASKWDVGLRARYKRHCLLNDPGKQKNITLELGLGGWGRSRFKTRKQDGDGNKDLQMPSWSNKTVLIFIHTDIVCILRALHIAIKCKYSETAVGNG